MSSLDNDYLNMSYHGNQRRYGTDFTGKEVLLTFQMEQKSKTTGFCTQNQFEIALFFFFIK